MNLGDVVDQFHDENGFADAGAAEEADLAAFGIRREQIDDLDAGDENLRFRRLILESRRRLMNGTRGLRLDGPCFIDRLADDVHDAPERFIADGHCDGCPGIDDFLAAHETFGRVHRDRAHRVFAQVLRDLENQAIAMVLRLERVQNFRQLVSELHVDDGTRHLANLPNVFSHFCLQRSVLERFRTRNDFDEFFGDVRLTLTVVLDRQLVDHVAGVARGVVHRRHARALL